MIPALRASFATALSQFDNALIRLRQESHLIGPWLGDETSGLVADHYARRAIDDSNSSTQSLLAYRAELGRICDALQKMEDHYRRTEGDNTALWGRKA
jgi:hypothetical protein